MVKLKRIILVNFNRFVKGTKRTKIDIEFPQDYHTIMIVGDNGTGKSTLASELNLLPSISDGYDIVPYETGEKIVYFTYNNEDYKVHYIYKPNGESHSCIADLAKIENGKQVQIVESSSVNEVKARIKQMIGLDTKLMKLAYLNSEDRGIVNMKSGARRDFMQSISPIGDTKELVKVISEKYIHAKKTREAKEKELANLPSSESLLMDKSNTMAEIAQLKNLENKVKDENVCMSDEEVLKLKLQVEELDKDSDIITKIRDIIDEYKMLTTLGDYMNARKNEKSKLQGALELLSKNIVDANLRLAESQIASEIDVDIIKKELDNHEYLSINNKRHFTTNDKLSSFILGYNQIKEFLGNIEDVSNLVDMKDVYNEVQTSVAPIKALYSELENKIERLERLREDKYVADNLVSPPESCKDDSCLLRKEFINMRARLEEYEAIVKDIQDSKERLSEVKIKLDRYDTQVNALYNIKLVYSIIENNDTLSILGDFLKSKDNFRRYLLDGNAFSFDGVVEDIIYVSRVAISYFEKKQEYDKAINRDIVVIKSNLDTWNVEYKETLAKIEKVNEKIPRVSQDIETSRYFNMSLNDMQEIQLSIIEDSVSIRNIIAKDKAKRIEQAETQEKLKRVEDNIKELEESLKKIDFNISLREYVEDELKKATIDEKDSEKIRETLTKHLPVKVMRRIVLNLKEITNNFLELTDIPYRVHDFTITEKDFIIKVQKDEFVSDDISKMSDGEKAIMALATTLALNSVMIPNYNVFILDEMDATLSKENKRKFLDIIVNFASVKDLQVFAISHNEYYSATEADSIGVIEMTSVGDLKVIPYLSYI